jgi:ribonucleoside-diphosphate reductase alpha chain
MDTMEHISSHQPSNIRLLSPALADGLADKALLLSVTYLDGHKRSLNVQRLWETIAWASYGHESVVDMAAVVAEVIKNVFDGITKDDLSEALILGAVSFIEKDPAYNYVASRLLFKKLYKQVTGKAILKSDCAYEYRQAFLKEVQDGLAYGYFDARMANFDLNRLAYALVPERDALFDYMGLRTLYERYFVRHEKKRMELPQAFWMRVAMGISLKEDDPTGKAIEFYDIMSQFLYVPGTPTLLHAGLEYPQLSSCFLATVDDDLSMIFKCFADNAQLSKWSGGVANDWTNIRGTGALIKSIKTESQGVIPFLKINSDVTASINRSGKRRAATVVYLECWHYDYEDFLDLRRNTGDERRRAHDINTASWIPDLFMKRMLEDGQWILISPDEAPDLHHLYGKAFEEKYCAYEKLVEEGKIRLFKIVSARQLWRKMLSRLFETGHPWITFKDPCNIRSPQDHAGVVHSSNLCTEITLNTSADEVAVCNLGSVSIGRHIMDGQLDDALLARTVEVAIRALDNVIDLNFYPIVEAKTANIRHRPVGLGVMGLQDALFKLDIPFADKKALEFSDMIQEKIAYYAIMGSSRLAKERGAYESYKGSKWDRDILPQDTIALLEAERGLPVQCDKTERLDWTPVRQHIKQHGMRNSNTMAIAPTATISTITDCYPCIEPMYKNLYVKANMSGEFTIVNKYLVEDLKALNLWNQDMLDQLKYYDGNLSIIDAIPARIKDKYKEAFEIDPLWLIQITAARGKWIDQSQSHNVFMRGVSGQMLHDIYVGAWQAGLKTMYYLRTLGASQIEKSTLDAKKFGFTQKRDYKSMTETSEAEAQEILTSAACSLSTDPDCDVCQ